MKNVIYGMIIIFVFIYSVVFIMSVYSITIHKNRLDRELSIRLESLMNRYYIPDGFVSDDIDYGEVERNIELELENDMKAMAGRDTELNIDYFCCDIKKGLIAVSVKMDFTLPTGRKKTIKNSKTIIVDREE